MIINFKGIVIKPEEVIYFKKMNKEGLGSTYDCLPRHN